MKRPYISAVALLVVVGGVYVGWRIYAKLTAGQGPEHGRRGLPVPVEVAPVRTATLQDIGHFSGSLVPDSKFLIASRVNGRLEKLLVNLGDGVRRGQSIVVLDDEEYVQQAERAKAELLVAQASVQECQSNLENAKREFQRAEALLQKKIASESEYDQAKAQYQVHGARARVATAQVDQKQAALKEAEIRLSYTKIAANWEGGVDTRYVGERYVDEGALLTANAPIVSIIDIATLTAAVYVIERDYAKIAIGQQAKVTTDAFPGRVFTGQIVRIAPQLQESSRQARVEIAVANADRLLKPGMFVRVELEFAEHKDAATIPSSALVRREGRQGVFVADPVAQKAHFVPVELGIAGGDLIEIVSPRPSGPVVVMGQHLLEDGAAIAISPSPALPPASPPAGVSTPASQAASQGARS